ncbi:hypothetical protein [Streptomyces sp. NPDC048248]|uniref:hypothetical protein n=1 Tax=Streptomyces sp. NPDC048248 TaxID=3365523 RepID=UPI00371640EB
MTRRPAREAIVRGLARAIARFEEMAESEIMSLGDAGAGGKKRRRSTFFDKKIARSRALTALLDEELPDGDSLIAAAITEGDYWERSSLRPAFVNSPKDGAGDRNRLAKVALGLRRDMESASILECVERAVGCACGPQIPDWEYVGVNITPEDSESADIGGWQIAGFDYGRDQTLPINGAPGMSGDLNSPETYHSVFGYGLLRRPLNEFPVPTDDDEPRVLVWPLLTLNMALDPPVLAGPRYCVEPGRGSAAQYPGWGTPSEVFRWGYASEAGIGNRALVIPEAMLKDVAAFCRAAQRLIDFLDPRSKEQLARAADHFMFVKCHVLGSSSVPTLHSSETAFRLTAALECLLAGGSGGRVDLSRKVQQRASVLVGQDDSDRLRVRDVVSAGYSARSAYVHGDRERASDLLTLKSITRRVLAAWLVQSAHCQRQSGRFGGKYGVANLLDDALLSRQVFDAHVAEPRRRFLGEVAPSIPFPLSRYRSDYRSSGPLLNIFD